MHTRLWNAAFRTLIQTRVSSVSARLAIPPRMHTHTEDRTLGEALSRNPVFERLCGALHLNNQHEGLALFIAQERVTLFIQGNEMHFEMGGVGDDPNDHS